MFRINKYELVGIEGFSGDLTEKILTVLVNLEDVVKLDLLTISSESDAGEIKMKSFNEAMWQVSTQEGIIILPNLNDAGLAHELGFNTLKVEIINNQLLLKIEVKIVECL